jgi:hypothetical protein
MNSSLTSKTMSSTILGHQHFVHSAVLNSYTNNEAEAKTVVNYLISLHRPYTAY